jgi:hypothetical protein
VRKCSVETFFLGREKPSRVDVSSCANVHAESRKGFFFLRYTEHCMSVRLNGVIASVRLCQLIYGAAIRYFQKTRRRQCALARGRYRS